MSQEEANSDQMPALKEEDLAPEALVIFLVIAVPILVIYCAITVYCKCQRKKRKALEIE